MRTTTKSSKTTYSQDNAVSVKNSVEQPLRKKNIIPISDSLSENTERTIFINGDIHTTANIVQYIDEVKPLVPAQPTPSIQPPVEPMEPTPPLPIQPPSPAPQIIPEPAQPSVPPIVPLPQAPPAPGSPEVPEVPFVPMAAYHSVV